MTQELFDLRHKPNFEIEGALRTGVCYREVFRFLTWEKQAKY